MNRWPFQEAITWSVTVSPPSKGRSSASVVLLSPWNLATLLSRNHIRTPYLIAAYNSHLEIKAGRVVSLIPQEIKFLTIFFPNSI